MEELTELEDKHLENFEVVSEDRQTDQINRFYFSAICLFRYLGHELVETFAFVFLFLFLLYQCFSDLCRFSIVSIRHVEDSVATDSGEMIRHSTRAHSIPSPRRSVLILIMIMALLCEYVNLCSHPTYVILGS